MNESQVKKVRVIEIPLGKVPYLLIGKYNPPYLTGSNFAYELNHSSQTGSSCSSIQFQIGMQSPQNSVLADLLTLIAYQPTYDQLRTKEQLGYNVWTYVDIRAVTLSVVIGVESNKDPIFVQSRIDAFLDNFQVGQSNSNLLPGLSSLSLYRQPYKI